MGMRVSLPEVFCRWMANSTEGGLLPPFLESSYLENERVTFVPGDVVSVGLCGEKDGCKAGDGILDVKEGLSKDKLLSALKVRLPAWLRRRHHVLLSVGHALIVPRHYRLGFNALIGLECCFQRVLLSRRVLHLRRACCISREYAAESMSAWGLAYHRGSLN